MKFEPLQLTAPLKGEDNGKPLNGVDELTKTPRLPRWTRQEILILIQGKKLAETRTRHVRVSGSEFGSGQVLEPKWSTISSYCKKHGVDRGPVQCRKRWSNLAGDFKKIREFEGGIRDETESFWCMRNDVRREKKLPGFFDREVYEILCGGRELGGDVVHDDVLFSEFDRSSLDGGGGGSVVKVATPLGEIAAPTPISVAYQASAIDADKEFHRMSPKGHADKEFNKGFYVDLRDESNHMGKDNEREPALDEGLGSTQGGKKRKLFTPDEDEEAIHWQQHLIKTLERNGTLLSSQLEAQTNRYQLEREQQKDHASNLVAVLSRVADALGKIADKL